jgi:LysM repeat protein
MSRYLRLYSFAGNIIMMLKKSLAAIYIISLFMISCRTSKVAVTPTGNSGTSKSYINTYKDMAISEMRRTGIPASITLAQGMIESGNGKSSLAVDANNHFGIKCHDDWKGPTVKHNDDRRNECFRKYRTPGESFKDHSDFLKTTPRYKSLFELGTTDYKGWAKGLKKAGYATNPDYANMLIRKIEEYGLYEYDSSTITASSKQGKKAIADTVMKAPADSVKLSVMESPTGEKITFRALPERIKENNRIQYIIVNEHDTRSSIEKEFELLPWELPRYNELKSDFELIPGTILYLQPKRDRAEPGKETYTVKEGDTMYLISQQYGIKFKKLLQLNRMEEGKEPAPGQKIWLRNIRPVV